MIDSATFKRIEVNANEGAGPSIWVSRQYMEAVRKVLDQHKIPYWVDHHYLSVDRGPFIGTIHIREGVDARVVQELVDRAE